MGAENPSRLRVALRRLRGDRAATAKPHLPASLPPPLPPEEAIPRRTAAAGGLLLPQIQNPPQKSSPHLSSRSRFAAAALTGLRGAPGLTPCIHASHRRPSGIQGVAVQAPCAPVARASARRRPAAWLASAAARGSLAS
jgi:hypothetical protein